MLSTRRNFLGTLSAALLLPRLPRSARHEHTRTGRDQVVHLTLHEEAMRVATSRTVHTHATLPESAISSPYEYLQRLLESLAVTADEDRLILDRAVIVLSPDCSDLLRLGPKLNSGQLALHP